MYYLKLYEPVSLLRISEGAMFELIDVVLLELVVVDLGT